MSDEAAAGEGSVRIRDFDPRTDLDGLRACLVALQDREHELDPRLPPGAAIAGAYVPDLLERCRRHAGRIVVAEVDGQVAGYAAVLTRMRSENLWDGDLEFALLADLAVRDGYRRRGIGRALLAAAESHARACGARCMRLGVLARNREAMELYRAADFQDYGIQLEKRLEPPPDAAP